MRRMSWPAKGLWRPAKMALGGGGGGFAGSAAFVTGGVALVYVGLNNRFSDLSEIFVQPGDTPALWTARVKAAPLPIALVGLSSFILLVAIVDGTVASIMLWIILLLIVTGRGRFSIAGKQIPQKSNQGTVLIAN